MIKSLLGWVGGNKILFAAIVVLAGTVATEGWLLKRSYVANGALQAKYDELTKASLQNAVDLGHCQETLKETRIAHAQCIGQIRFAQALADDSKIAIDNLAEAIRHEAVNVRRLRGEIYRTPGCQELARLDIAAACPALAVSLRSRARGVMPAAREGRSRNARRLADAPDG